MTDRPTDRLMPSDKHNSKITKAAGLISSLQTCRFINCSSSNACIMVLPALAFVLFCSPFILFSTTTQGMVRSSTASYLHRRLTNCSDCRCVSHTILLLKTFYKILCTTKNKALSRFNHFTATHRQKGVHTVTSKFLVFPYSGKKRYFSCSFLSVMLCNGVSICEYEAYWHMNFSLIIWVCHPLK